MVAKVSINASHDLNVLFSNPNPALKLYLITQYIKLRCKEWFRSPTWPLTFESLSQAWKT